MCLCVRNEILLPSFLSHVQSSSSPQGGKKSILSSKSSEILFATVCKQSRQKKKKREKMLLQDEKSAKSDLLRAVLARDVAGLREMLDGGVVLTEDLLRLDMMRGAITMAKPWSGRGCPRRSRGWSSANQEEEEGEVDFCCCGGGDLLLLICRAPGYLLRQEMAILLIRHGAPAGAAHLAWAARGGNDDLAAYILEAGAAPPAEGVLAKWEEEEEVPDSLRQMCQSYRCVCSR